MKEMLGGCCVCADENGWEANPLVYCDGPNCEVAVHQGCYGIIKVPEGEWYCAKCADLLTHIKLNGGENVMEMHETPRCELCPFGHGALKRTDNGGWAHVICALYIPEVRFGDVHSMDPVILNDVPLERFQQPCYLCTERGDRKQALQGACMSCNKLGCKRVFHVTCAQAEGLLCEEGAGSKNVKYCGYCSQHAKKAISDPLIKVIPPYRHREQSSSCSSTTSGGGGQQFSPHFNSSYNGNVSSSDGFINRRLSLNSSPLSSGLYGSSNQQLNSVTQLPAASIQRTAAATTGSVSDGSGLRESEAMLVDPIHRNPLSQNSVDRAIMSAMMSQPIVGQTVLDRACASPVSSGRSSAVQDSSSPVAPNISSATKNDQSSNAEMHVSSATVVPLPSNISKMVTAVLPKEDAKPLLADNALNNENIATLAPNHSLVSPVYASVDGKTISGIQRAVKRPRTNQTGDKTKKPRSNIRANKSMKTLLESVGPLVSETVTDFQRERVNERDAAAAAAASTTSHIETPSTSGENVSTFVRSPDTSQAGYYGSVGVNSKVNSFESSVPNSGTCLPSTSVSSTEVTKLCGAPLLRGYSKGISSPEVTQPNSSVDRHHVSSSAPSTSLGLSSTGGIQPAPLPQTLEELLERQWEQGSHFMMAHAPFDVAQLLSCLHELKKENVRLEGELNGLVRRRDHLLAVNAQLTLGLQSSTAPTNGSINSPRVNGTAPNAQLSISTLPPQAGTIPSPANVGTLPVSMNPVQQQSQQQQVPSASTRVVGTPITQPASSNAANYGPPLDDSLNKLRNLTTGNNLATAPARSSSTVAALPQLPSATAPPVVGRPASRPAPSNTQSAAPISSNLQQSQLPGFSQNRIPSTASASSATTPTSSTPSSLPSTTYTAVTTSKSSIVGGSNDVVAASSTTTTAISPERQQQLAAAAVAAALGNTLNGNFLTSRTSNPLNSTGVTSTATNNPFASSDFLAQYALLQHQLMQQQAAAAAALRFGGIVMSGNSTPPTSSSNSQTTTGHSGK